MNIIRTMKKRPALLLIRVGFPDLQLKNLTKILGNRVREIKVGKDIEMTMAMTYLYGKIRTTGGTDNRAIGEIEIKDSGTIREVFISLQRGINKALMHLQAVNRLSLKWRKCWQEC